MIAYLSEKIRYRSGEDVVRVLVLDANQRAALAIVRSLGRRGLHIITADRYGRTLAGASKFAAGNLVYPDIEKNQNQFLGWLDVAVVENAVDVIIPVTEISVDVVTRNRHRWQQCSIPFAEVASVDELSDKVRLYEVAMSVGVPVPRSVVIRTAADLKVAEDEIGFPCILKPRRSRLFVDGIWRDTAVRRANSSAELHELFGNEPGLTDLPILYQEFIPGHGAGVFALYRGGKPCAWFAHRRLREKPPSGGVSVLSESIEVPEELASLSKQLLDRVGWEGVAMIEYRVDPQGAPYLMEINARFWGSLQLAVDAGVDFPALLLEQIAPGHERAANRLIPGRRLRWMLGDLDRLWLVLKSRRGGGWQVAREMAAFLKPDLSGRLRHEVFRWDDPGPALVELIRYIRLLHSDRYARL